MAQSSLEHYEPTVAQLMLGMKSCIIYKQCISVKQNIGLVLVTTEEINAGLSSVTLRLLKEGKCSLEKKKSLCVFSIQSSDTVAHSLSSRNWAFFFFIYVSRESQCVPVSCWLVLHKDRWMEIPTNVRLVCQALLCPLVIIISAWYYVICSKRRQQHWVEQQIFSLE